MALSSLTDRISSAGARLVSELLVVVIGVLIALWADSLWSNRHDRAEELQILEAIQEDVSVTISLVGVMRSRVEGDLRNLKMLTLGSSGPAATLPTEGMAELLSSLWDVPPISVQMSALDEIEDSGRVRLIGDRGLRELLAHYRQAFEYVRVSHLDAFQNQHLKLDPYLIAHVQMAQLSRFALAHDAGASPEQIAPLSPLRDHRLLLDDELFQNQVAAKFYLLSYYRFQAAELLGLLHEIDAAIVRRSDDLSGRVSAAEGPDAGA